MLDAVIITLTNNAISSTASRKCLASLTNAQKNEIGVDNAVIANPLIMPATTVETAVADLQKIVQSESFEFPSDNIIREGIPVYTWPIEPSQDRLDLATGLYMKAYKATDYRKIVACTISHMRAWLHCVTTNKDLMVLEHDAYFNGNLKLKSIYKQSANFGIVSLNSPYGATRRPGQFDMNVQTQFDQNPDNVMFSIPNVNTPEDPPLPQGLPGNSAYIIQPWAAKKLLEKISEVGIWPNDALICKEFFPWIKTVYPYTTTVQGTPSTTTS